MTLSEKSAYLKGLMEGMKLDTETNEGKLISEIVSMLQDVAENVSDLEEVVDCISDELDCIEEDLDNIDDYLMDDDDDEQDDNWHRHASIVYAIAQKDEFDMKNSAFPHVISKNENDGVSVCFRH